MVAGVTGAGDVQRRQKQAGNAGLQACSVQPTVSSVWQRHHQTPDALGWHDAAFDRWGINSSCTAAGAAEQIRALISRPVHQAAGSSSQQLAKLTREQLCIGLEAG